MYRTIVSFLLLCVPCQAQSLDFDGSNDYIELDTQVNDALSSDNTWTIALWFKTDAVSNNRTMFSSAESNGTHSRAWIQFRNTNQIGSGYYEGPYSIKGITGFTDTSGWHHWVTTFNGTSTIKTYRNGSEETDSIGGTTSGTVGTHIGSQTDLSAYHDGLIDDVRIYNKVLTDVESEILAKMTGHQARNRIGGALASGLIAHWEFEDKPIGDQASGASSVIDTVGGNNGTPNGGTSLVYARPAGS